MANTTIVTRHSVSDTTTGITVSDKNGVIEISGLDLSADKLASLEMVLDLWKGGLAEDTDIDGDE